MIDDALGMRSEAIEALLLAKSLGATISEIEGDPIFSALVKVPVYLKHR